MGGDRKGNGDSYLFLKMNLDDIKTGLASVIGLGNWMVEIDLMLKVSISTASLVYIILKIRALLKNGSK
tara:strand:+ start:486 stop:692 length:207 start_codon:yes stop_codon:yes gene_type:complete